MMDRTEIMKIDELLQRRRMQTKIIHEITFYSTMVLTVLFFWALGGKSRLWCIILASFGIALDLNKKNQLELAAVTVEKVERRARKAVALTLSVFTLLSGLGAALNRTLIVTNEEAIAVDTTSIDAEITSWEKDLAIQQDQQLTATRREWRDDAYAKAENAKKQLKTLRDQRDTLLKGHAKTEKVSDMFSLLASFFGFKDSGRFMVFLLMLAQIAMELSVWVTTTQYWKDAKTGEKAPETAPKTPIEPKIAKPAPVVQAKNPPIAQSRPVKATIPQKTTPIPSMADKVPQKPAIELSRLTERDLMADVRRKSVKTPVKSQELDLFGGEYIRG
jgi:hypothetical protein